jgi:hypothetical protein
MPRQRANYPSFDLAWATNASTQLEPTATEKATGWAVNAKIPAKKINWLWDAFNKWIKAAIGAALGNLMPLNSPPSVNSAAIVWVENYGIWVACDSTGATYYSYDGSRWYTGATCTAAALANTGNEDTTGRTIFAVGTKVAYDSDPRSGTFTEVDPGVGTLSAVRVAFNSDAVVVAGATGPAVAYSTSVASGSWFTASTAEQFVDIVSVATSVWLGISATGKIYRSIDAGASWSLYGDAGLALGGYTFDSLDIDLGSGAVVAGAHETSGAYNNGVAYSSDVGLNWWASPTSFPVQASGALKPMIVRNLGGYVWLMGTSTDTAAAYDGPGVWFSLDAGINWLPVEFNDGIDTGSQKYGRTEDLGFNGRRFMVKRFGAPYYLLGSNAPQ